MSTMNVSLSDQMRAWVDEQVKGGPYADAGDYVRDLIRRDRQQRENLVEALIEGEASGVSTRTVRQIVAAAKAKIENGAL